jgi:hypothetical protein
MHACACVFGPIGTHLRDRLLFLNAALLYRSLNGGDDGQKAVLVDDVDIVLEKWRNTWLLTTILYIVGKRKVAMETD